MATSLSAGSGLLTGMARVSSAEIVAVSSSATGSAWVGIAVVASSAAGSGVPGAAAGLPRNSPSHDSISRSGCGGADSVRRWAAAAAALFTAFLTALRATANRVVGASATSAPAAGVVGSGIRAVPAAEGGSCGAGGAVRPTVRGRGRASPPG